MIIPDKNQWRGWVALALIQALLVWLDAPLALNWGLLAAWLMLLMASALLLWREKPDFRINRDYGAVQQSGQPFTMQLALHNAVPRDLALHLFDHYPPQAESSAMPQRTLLGTDERLELAYPLTIHARGRFRFTALQLRYPDRLALWQRDLRLDAPADVRVYPRFAHDHADSAFAGIRTPQLGHVHPLYKRGGNGDFSHLRNYLDGDSINRLDHKASARLGKWQVREYDYEHEQPVILMLDAHEGVSEQDAHLLGEITRRGRALIIAINKWDHLNDEQRQAIRSQFERKLHFVDYAEVFYISALHGSNIRQLLPAVKKVYRAAMAELSTNKLTEALQTAYHRHQPPLVQGHSIKLQYAHQGGRNPPHIIIHGTRTTNVPASYTTYLSKFFREHFKLHGTPVRISYRDKANPYSDK